MKSFKSLILLVLIFSLFSFSISFNEAFGFSCPSTITFQNRLYKLQPKFRSIIKVLKINPSPVKGICEVVLRVGKFQKALVYTDSSGRYLISGKIIDLKTKTDLTKEKLLALNKIILNKKMLKKLDSLVDITYGKGKKVFYFITDPKCPFCKRAEQIVYKVVKEAKNVKVKVILFPLERIHPGSKKRCVSLICDKKGYKALLSGYESSNQCKTGKEKIEENIDFLIKDLHITAVPAFVFPDTGEVKLGIMSEKDLLKRLEEMK